MRRSNIFQRGGDKPYNIDAYKLNRFTDEEIEKHMNPVYGLIMCETGYLINLYFLKKSGLLDSFSENYSKSFDEEMQKSIKDIILEHSRIIDKVCTLQHGLNILEPTKKIMDMKPKDMLLELGRYIAIKYINKLSNKQNSKIEKIVVTNTKNNVVLNQKYAIFKNITKDEKQTIIKSVERFNRFINFENDDIFTFQMLLFCLWWKSDNKEGIDQYYRGIEEVFEIFNSFNKKNLDIIPLTLVYSDSISTSASTNKSFEQLVLDITNIDFLLYSQQSSKHFCPEIEPSTYPDCGETVARNIINILCFNGNNFDTKILEKKGAIPELIEYYTVFNNFASQSTTETTDIFGLKLNARDAWSKLVINKSQENIRFGKNCQGKYGYDMRGGLTQDDTRSNLLQMLNNLFKCDESTEGNCINTWEDLATGGNITEINATNVKTGIGIITIKNKFKQEFKAKLESGHYSIELPKKKDKISYNHLSQPQKDILDVLTKTNITEKNYIEMNFSSEQLVDTIKLNTIPDYVKFGMFELSLTDKYDNDTRRRIIIYTEDDLFDSICDLFEIVATKFGIKEKELIEKNLNNYTFRLFQDFEFVRRLPALKVLNLSDNSRLINDTQNNSRFIDDTMDLSPLEQIEEIGDNFLREFIFVKKIDLSPLYNVHTIGNDFMFKCSSIKKVDLSSLTKLTKIGNKFMNNCESLETIIFNPEPIITFIGSEFMYYCEELKTIDLRFLKNIEVISYGFLHDCSNLENVIFPDKFGKVKKINSNFMSETGLQNINLSCFSNVEDIQDNFLEQCVELESVDLSSLTKLYTIGDAFLSGCERLNEIKFSDDANITSVGEYFLSWTNSLTQVDLKCFSQIKMIPRYFLVESGLTCANLSSFTKLTLISIEFMVQCKNLKTVIMPENFRTKIRIGVDFLNNSPVINLWEGDRKCPNVLVSESSASKSPAIESPAIESPASRNHTDSGSRNARSNCTNNKCTIMGGKKRTQKNKKKLKKSTRKHKIFYRQ